jgi:hypothetical protein
VLCPVQVGGISYGSLGVLTISWSLPVDEVQQGNSSRYKFGYVGGRSSKAKLLVSIGMAVIEFHLNFSTVICYSRYK